MKHGNQKVINPLFISRNLVREGEEEFIGGEQEDAYEFFQKIRDTIELAFIHLDKYEIKSEELGND